MDEVKTILTLPFKLDGETLRRLSVVGADVVSVLAQRVKELNDELASLRTPLEPTP